MPTAREIMTPNAECVNAGQTTADAAEKMRSMDVGSLPICGEDNRFKGMITDRDIVVQVIAQGRDPKSCLAGELGGDEVVTIGADDAWEILRTMSSHKVRRLPVIDGHELVGMVALADVAEALPDAKVGDLMDALTTD
ncbi:CBS domain-containing protein [Streptosporangium sp. NPDC050280]|uniref:CBS domain-containing protein n=1 Tax=unclassified Streptosporangium TaxID=2632669 RepID=UPI003418B2A4